MKIYPGLGTGGWGRAEGTSLHAAPCPSRTSSAGSGLLAGGSWQLLQEALLVEATTHQEGTLISQTSLLERLPKF